MCIMYIIMFHGVYSVHSFKLLRGAAGKITLCLFLYYWFGVFYLSVVLTDCYIKCLSLDHKSNFQNILLVIYFRERVSCEPLELLGTTQLLGLGIVYPLVLRGKVLRTAWGISVPAFLWLVTFDFFSTPYYEDGFLCILWENLNNSFTGLHVEKVIFVYEFLGYIYFQERFSVTRIMYSKDVQLFFCVTVRHLSLVLCIYEGVFRKNLFPHRVNIISKQF